MLADPREQHIAAAFKAARPLPRAGWDGRALAALADIRPRRHPNLVLIIIILLILLPLLAGAFVALRHFLYIEGTLLFGNLGHVSVTDTELPPVSDHYLSRYSERLDGNEPDALSIQSITPPFRGNMEILYLARRAGFHRRDRWPPTTSDIVTINFQGGDEINLTQAAGIGGVNCYPMWSPDETEVAFSHSDPEPGQLPCLAGFSLWLMNADGSNLQRITGDEMGSVMPVYAWRETGTYLHCRQSLDPGPGEPPGVGMFGRTVRLVDVDLATGEIVRVYERGGVGPSPDKSMGIQTRTVWGQLDGRPGVWNQLVLYRRGEAQCEVLVEQFIADEDVDAHYPTEEQFRIAPDFDWRWDLWTWVSPREENWSPRGDRIAFAAALPWDPDGPFYKNQIEVWVYDLTTGDLIRITDDDAMQHSVGWIDEYDGEDE
ncbi:MAG: hypothetical protein JSV79_01985 [Armatimonadota bacterium]|nr:MAG: hypothetical protein JSV79_01985 [Armatimonadota bacterium]